MSYPMHMLLDPEVCQTWEPTPLSAFPNQLLRTRMLTYLTTQSQAEAIMASQHHRRRGGRSRQHDATNLAGGVQEPNRSYRYHSLRHPLPVRPDIHGPCGPPGYDFALPQQIPQNEGNPMMAHSMQMSHQRREMENWNRMYMDQCRLPDPLPVSTLHFDVRKALDMR